MMPRQQVHSTVAGASQLEARRVEARLPEAGECAELCRCMRHVARKSARMLPQLAQR